MTLHPIVKTIKDHFVRLRTWAHPDTPRHGSSGFTRLELAAVLSALALLSVIALPALANMKPRTQRLTCLSNLREIGQSFAAWSSEYENRLPSQVVSAEGGTFGHVFQNNIWFQFATISNHVRTPRIFVCPSDSVKREASDFSVSPFGGFLNANYQNNALSYLLGHPMLEARPDVLAADRHVANGFNSGACLYWSPTLVLQRFPGPTARWTDTLHAASGNVVLSDGRVEQLSSSGLRQRLSEGTSENNSEFHYLSP